jgi:hypothetical protein
VTSPPGGGWTEDQWDRAPEAVSQKHKEGPLLMTVWSRTLSTGGNGCMGPEGGSRVRCVWERQYKHMVDTGLNALGNLVQEWSGRSPKEGSRATALA